MTVFRSTSLVGRSAAILLALVACFLLAAPLNLVTSSVRAEKQTDPNERTESREDSVTSVCSVRRTLRRHDVTAAAAFNDDRRDDTSRLKAGIATVDCGFARGIFALENGCGATLRC
jgi:sigma54-dependent transcription regulator